MTSALDAAIAQVREALVAHHWPSCASPDARLEPVRSLFALIHAQRALGEIGKDELMAAGIEFNRMVLDTQGRRHNTSVDEANTCFKAGRALAAALAPLAGAEQSAAEESVLRALEGAPGPQGGTP
jgi:hypothetical protein